MSFEYLSLFVVINVMIGSTVGSVRFTKEPPKVLYVRRGGTARFVWDYQVDNKDTEFDINSPKWNYYNSKGVAINIASEDMFKDWKWVIHRATCPPRLLNPTRVSRESVATLVISNVTTADNGTYECSLVLLRTSSPITSRVELIVSGKEDEKLKDENEMSVARFQESAPRIYISMSDRMIKSWNGHLLSLRCIVTGSPAPTVTWYSPNGSNITISSRPISRGSELTIKTLKDNDYGVYTCRAVNSLGFDELNITVSQICLCSSSKNKQHHGKATFIKHKTLYVVCSCVIGLSGIMNILLLLKVKAIARSTRKVAEKSYQTVKYGPARNDGNNHDPQVDISSLEHMEESCSSSSEKSQPYYHETVSENQDYPYDNPEEAFPAQESQPDGNDEDSCISQKQCHYQSLCFAIKYGVEQNEEICYQSLQHHVVELESIHTLPAVRHTSEPPNMDREIQIYQQLGQIIQQQKEFEAAQLYYTK